MSTAVAPERFAALARSSPWLWRTLRFTVRWQGPYAGKPVRAWLRRPGALRVEGEDGEVLQVEGARRPRTMGVFGPGKRSETVQMYGPLDPRAPCPRTDAAGLVLGRPQEPGLDFDDPMYVNYHWVAMLDPAEFADGLLDEPVRTPAPALEVDSIVEATHHGRAVWEARVRPTPAYEPRCGCCPLLFSKVSEDKEAGGGNFLPAHERDPALRYADAYLVRLDVQTGVCVHTEELGGSRAGAGHDLRIEAVDEPMPEALFRS